VCAELIPAIHTLYQHEKKYIEFIIISMLEDEVANQTYVNRHQLNDIPYCIVPKIIEAYQVTTSPYAILVGADGTIQTKGMVNRLEHLESLLNVLEEGYASFDSKMNALTVDQEASDKIIQMDFH
jgi:methylamine dehydrogenase accessory protein MauD